VISTAGSSTIRCAPTSDARLADNFGDAHVDHHQLARFAVKIGFDPRDRLVNIDGDLFRSDRLLEFSEFDLEGFCHGDHVRVSTRSRPAFVWLGRLGGDCRESLLLVDLIDRIFERLHDPQIVLPL
jgi:hypothetical protein